VLSMVRAAPAAFLRATLWHQGQQVPQAGLRKIVTAGSPDVLWLFLLRALGHAECTRDHQSIIGQLDVRRPPLASLAGEPPAAPDGAAAAQPGAGALGAPAAPPPGAPAAAAAPAPPRPRRVREDENTVVVRGTRYTKLECVGRGGSSKVFKVRRGSVNCPRPLQGSQVRRGAPAGMRAYARVRLERGAASAYAWGTSSALSVQVPQ